MKKITSFLMLFLMCFGMSVFAQTPLLGNVDYVLDASKVNALTTKTRVAYKNISGTNNYWFAGTKNIQHLSNEAVFILEPVKGGYKLKHFSTDQYIANQNAKVVLVADSSQAQVFIAHQPKLGQGSGKDLLNTANESWQANGVPMENVVRSLCVGQNLWLNVRESTGNPCFNTGTGGYTVNMVYDMSDFYFVTFILNKGAEKETRVIPYKVGDKISAPVLEGFVASFEQQTMGASDVTYEVNYTASPEKVAELLIAEAQSLIPAFFNAVGTTDYFDTPERIAGYYAAINALNNEKISQEKYAALEKLVQEVKSSSICKFQPGKLYRIKNYQRILNNGNKDKVGEGGYLSSTQYPAINENAADVTCSTKALDDAGTVWIFEEIAGDNAHFLLKNCNTQTYAGDGMSPKTKRLFLQGKDKAGKYGLESMDADPSKEKTGKHRICCVGQKSLNPSVYGIEFWNNATNNAPESAWYIIPATELEVNMNQAAEGEYWASLYLPFNVSLPNGVEAYTAQLNGKYLNLPVQGTKEVPANNAVLLKGNAAQFNLVVAPATKDSLRNNSLVGTNVAMPKEGNVYTLGMLENVVGFYHPTADQLKANKAYLQVAGGAVSGYRFNFGEATGVEGVETDQVADGVYYDLSGRRVVAPAKGVYILNGKKVYVK